MMDIEFFDENGEIIKKNFEIPSKIDMKDNYWPKKTDDDEGSNDSNDYRGRNKGGGTPQVEDVQTKYELFATICFDAKKVDDMSYYPLVKKRHKQTNKP